ncbi:MAG: CHAT domain-containing protein, partial [Bacteroidota bacterium]
FESEYPNYYNLKYNNDFIGYIDVMKSLDARSVALEFIVTKDETFYLKMTKSNTDFGKISIGEDSLRVQLTRFKQLLSETKNDNVDFEVAYQKYSEWIYTNFISKAIDHKEYSKLLMLVDGPWESVPLDLLKIGTLDNSKYLLENISISYAYSFDQLFQAWNSHNTIKYKSELVSFAPSGFGVQDSLTYSEFRDLEVDLRWNKDEANKLAKTMNGRAVVDYAATETNFKKTLDSRIVHLATHAFFDLNNPMYSRLVFSKNDSTDDGYLFAGELYNMDLNAEMAVLSACNSGTAKDLRGEGGISLANAFMYAGVPSVVMSKWQVDDQSTSQLMQYFYENLKKGMTKSEALRQAKLTFLETAPPEKQHPFYWGAFVVIGDDSPLFRKSFTWVLPLTLLFFLVLVFISGELKRIKLAYS